TNPKYPFEHPFHGRRSVPAPYIRRRDSIYTPNWVAKSSIFFAAKLTGTRGADSPVPGPFSPGLAMCAVHKPFDAAERRSSLCAAHIITCLGRRLSAAAVIRYTAGFGLKSRAISEPKTASHENLLRRAMSTINA